MDEEEPKPAEIVGCNFTSECRPDLLEAIRIFPGNSIEVLEGEGHHVLLRPGTVLRALDEGGFVIEVPAGSCEWPDGGAVIVPGPEAITPESITGLP